MPRLTKIEKLARDICWVPLRKPASKAKAAYWRAIHPDIRAEYIRDAEWLVFIVQKLTPLRVLQFVDLPRQPKRSRR